MMTTRVHKQELLKHKILNEMMTESLWRGGKRIINIVRVYSKHALLFIR